MLAEEGGGKKGKKKKNKSHSIPADSFENINLDSFENISLAFLGSSWAQECWQSGQN